MQPAARQAGQPGRSVDDEVQPLAVGAECQRWVGSTNQAQAAVSVKARLPSIERSDNAAARAVAGLRRAISWPAGLGTRCACP